jgi:hypothetical protein
VVSGVELRTVGGKGEEERKMKEGRKKKGKK